MKLNSPKPKAVLAGDNMAILKDALQTKSQGVQYGFLLTLLADLLDTIASGQNCYAIIGATKDQSTFSVTVVSGADRASVYAPDLVALSNACQDLL